jgi:hypothetical protein
MSSDHMARPTIALELIPLNDIQIQGLRKIMNMISFGCDVTACSNTTSKTSLYRSYLSCLMRFGLVPE